MSCDGQNESEISTPAQHNSIMSTIDDFIPAFQPGMMNTGEELLSENQASVTKVRRHFLCVGNVSSQRVTHA